MSPRRSAAEASRARVQSADMASRRKPPRGGETFDREHLLARPVVRVVTLPEPVSVPAMVNGRPLRDWEAERYVEAMGRERRRELAMFEGLIG